MTATSAQSLLPELVKKKEEKLHEFQSTLESLKKINHSAAPERRGSAVQQVALAPPSMEPCNQV